MTTTTSTSTETTFDRALRWVARARNGATFAYKRGESPLDDAALDELSYAAGDRGYELFGDDAGLRVEKLDSYNY